jgi:L-lysine 2,3-aminomutase
VVHVNHPRELCDQVRQGLAALRAHGTSLLNQSVLLRGVNDDGETLAELSEALFDCGVLPYYLHLLDPVTGAAHFEVTEARARILMQRLRATLPGYLVPRLVRETAGTEAKQPVL